MPSETRSRRERPAKPPLSREWIIAATIEIMRGEGLDKATMRRVAQALDTGPASLYVYVANTAELHAAVLDELLAPLAAGPAGDWQGRLETLLGDYAAVLFAYPGLARSALVTRPSGPNAIRLYDQVLGLLLDGGAEPARAAWGVDLLMLYVTANAAEHSQPAAGDSDAVRQAAAVAAGNLTAAVRAARPSVAPHLAAHADAVLSGAPAQRIAWSLRALVAGILATPVPGGPDDGAP
jgi:AcrR family transcriptional regulator